MTDRFKNTYRILPTRWKGWDYEAGGAAIVVVGVVVGVVVVVVVVETQCIASLQFNSIQSNSIQII
jgi:hypothetical protein